MMDFGRWFSEQGQKKDLPDGVFEDDGVYMAICCVCGAKDELPCALSEIIDKENRTQRPYEHHCGRGPSCCP